MNQRTRTAAPMGAAKNNLDPWALVWGQPYIDSQTLAAAIEEDLQHAPNPDFRTRLLVRDAVKAIKSFWGPRRFARWLDQSPVGTKIGTILQENLGKPGFGSIRRRLVASISQEQLEQVFELLGRRIHDRVEVDIAGSIPTLIQGLSYRPTDDIDFVNEVPAQIRAQREAVDQVKKKYGLTLGHVQSHYLPANWQNRRRFLGDFGGIRVHLVDEYDIFVSKLSSKQEKHQDDLRVMAPKLDKDKVRKRLLTDGKAFLEDPHDRPTIEANWSFIYREPLLPAAAEREGPKARGANKSLMGAKKKGRKKSP